MMRVDAWTATFVAAVATLALASPADGFFCTRTDGGVSVAWHQRALEMRPSQEDGAELTSAELTAALAHAAAVWSAPSCSDMSVTVGGPTTEARVGFDYRSGKASAVNQNVVVFRTGEANDPLDEWVHNPSNLAITTITFLRATAELLDADIEVNDATFFFTACEDAGCQTRHDLKNTLTHEVGHVLGLDHPPSSQPTAADATMFATSSEGDLSKRELSQDDIEGLCVIYPTGGDVGDCGDFSPAEPVELTVKQVSFSCASVAVGHRSSLVMLFAIVGLGLLSRARRQRGGTSHLTSWGGR